MFRVEVGKGDLRFSAAHFISFLGKCERLHGHNYGVSAVLEGDLGPEGLLFDFVEIKRIVREICDSLDHRFLLPLESSYLQIQKTGEEWAIHAANRRYVFPSSDVFVLPVDNITAERLAEYICGRIIEKLQPKAGNLTSVTVGVEEAPGQTAFCRHFFRGEQIS
ncbi:MAG: 6-carboxytetrahydropterin synthase [Syntrophobacteraceae bacterium]|jgi:6-pyruvoyltetrahydropterin/6-carboxytetrahydropterin synthase